MKVDHTVKTNSERFSAKFSGLETKTTTINNKPATILYRPESDFIKTKSISRADEVKNVMVDEDIFYSSYEDGYESDNSFFGSDDSDNLISYQEEQPKEQLYNSLVEEQPNDQLYNSLVEEQSSFPTWLFIIPAILIILVSGVIGVAHYKSQKEQDEIDSARERLSERMKHIDYLEKMQNREKNPYSA